MSKKKKAQGVVAGPAPEAEAPPEVREHASEQSGPALVSSVPLEWQPRALIFALGFALLMIAVPLRYYLGSDRYDERFSWRMFSAVRVERCQAEVSETVSGTPRSVPLRGLLAEPWIQLLSRNRADVIWHFLEWRCATGTEEPSSVELLNRCVAPSGEPQPPIRRAVSCATLAHDESLNGATSDARDGSNGEPAR